MGSCISTITASHPSKSPNSLHSKSSTLNLISRSPPLPEEETVKEILSSESQSILQNRAPVLSQSYLSQIRFIHTACEKNCRRNGDVLRKPLGIDKIANDVVGKGKFHGTPKRKAGGKCLSDPEPHGVGSGFGYWRRDSAGEGSGRRAESVLMDSGTGSDPGGCWKTSIDPRSGEESRKAEVEWLPTSNELLENPPIALECFIFL